MILPSLQVLGEVASFLGSLGAEQLSAGCRSRGSSLATRIDFVTRRSSSRPRYCALISNTPAARIACVRSREKRHSYHHHQQQQQGRSGEGGPSTRWSFSGGQ